LPSSAGGATFAGWRCSARSSDGFRPDSDVDVLIEFEPEQRYTYFTLARIEADLSSLLGRKVDLHMSQTLHPFLRDKVLGQAEALYVGA
jgi:uncharacterized protein